MVDGFEKLDVWQKAKEFCKVIYAETRKFPDDEKFGLTNQIRRASISVISNIAEGSAKGSDKEFIRFIRMALGSSAEIKAQLIVSYELEYLGKDSFEKLKEEINIIGRMLKGLERGIENKDKK